MSSFIIPSGILGLVSPRTIYMDNGIQLSTRTLRRKVKFGDGYKYSGGASAPKRSASANFSAREPEEINLIEDYFIYLAGSPIDDLLVLTETWDGVVTQFNKNYMNGSLYGLSCVIEEK